MAESEMLRDLLRRKTREAVEEAVTNRAAPATEKIETLNRLTRLIEISEQSTRPAPSRPRWPVAAILAATLSVISLLLFVHVSDIVKRRSIRVGSCKQLRGPSLSPDHFGACSS